MFCMDLTSCFGKIRTSFNAEENVTTPRSYYSTLAYVEVDTSFGILDRASTSIMPLPIAINSCFSTTTKLKFMDYCIVSMKL
jgi:hypothetical protein